MPNNAAFLVRHYVRAHGLVAIMVTAGTRDAGVAVTRDPDARLRRLGRPRLIGLWWCRNRTDARRVVAAGRGLAAHEFPQAARSAGVDLVSHETIVAEAARAVAKAEAALAAMKAAGNMRPINRAYRDMRLRRQAAGLNSMPYPTFLMRYKIGLIYKVAASRRG